MVKYILDACALIAFLKKEPGGDFIRTILLEGNEIGMHALNLCEVYYEVVRAGGVAQARRLNGLIIASGIELREDMNPAIWAFAGQLKAHFKKISLADTFAAALAVRMDAILLTTDRSEFTPLANNQICEIIFIR